MQNENDLRELMKTIREGGLTPERSGEYWSKDEREEMVQSFQSGTGISEIALHLQRSEMAVVQQLMTAGLLTSPGANRQKGTRKPKCLCPGCVFYTNRCCQAVYCTKEEADA